jgi:ribonuclease HII
MREYENELYSKGVSYIAGVDEVGRGPLAGPVVAAAVVLPEDFSVLGINDSKKLTEKKREEFFEIITRESLAYGIGIADHSVIDEINILEATKKAMKNAVCEAGQKLTQKLGISIEHVLIDAVTLKELEIPQTSIIKGDEKSVSIAAASIVAKVTRDKMMVEFHKEYPYYSFNNNKGYGTKAHYEGISEHGLCEIHRRSFLKKIIEKENVKWK